MFCEIPTFARCCLCLPLRKGILAIGYVNAIFSLFMIGVYGFCIHQNYAAVLVFHGTYQLLPAEFCLTLYIVDFFFSVVLLYGGHVNRIICLKIFYYYTLATVAAMFIIEMLSSNYLGFWVIEAMFIYAIGLIFHLYLVMLIRSLINKVNTEGGSYENRLHDFVNGQVHIDTTEVYPSTTEPKEAV